MPLYFIIHPIAFDSTLIFRHLLIKIMQMHLGVLFFLSYPIVFPIWQAPPGNDDRRRRWLPLRASTRAYSLTITTTTTRWRTVSLLDILVQPGRSSIIYLVINIARVHRRPSNISIGVSCCSTSKGFSTASLHSNNWMRLALNDDSHVSVSSRSSSNCRRPRRTI